MNSVVSLLYWENLSASELNVLKIVEFLGGTVRTVKLTGETAQHSNDLKALVTPSRCLLTSARTFASLRHACGGTMGWQPELADLAAKVLVYGFEPMSSDAELLRELTAGALVAIAPSLTANRTIDVAQEPICRQLAGLRFEAPGTENHHTFVRGTGHNTYTPLMSIGQKPFLVRLQDEHCEAVLLAGGPIVDLDTVVPRGTSVLQSFVGLAPVLMFLHASLQQHLWHNDAPAACFIVDDPLLKRRYGCLDYQKLLALMDRKHFSTSIAFIPWNHRRSQRRVATLLASRPGAYSLCVHGCDHTRGEFGSNDSVVLRQKARQALERMKSHRRLSGLDFDDVMVFPQGIFSTAAMSALKSCGYLAAVNSTAFPVDADRTLTLRDLLQVAVTRFANFPLFTRRYPQHLPELAFDLFLGKPMLVVEHHGFFRDGYDALAETIETLHRLEPRLQWAKPATICSRACWTRVAEDGDIHVLFFTDRFGLRNETSQPQQYVLIRHGLPELGTAVIINGRRVDVREESDGVQARLLLGAGEVAEIRIEDGQPEAMSPPPTPRLMYQAGVFIRRSLSEFRDNYLDMNPFVSRAVRNRQG